MREIKFRAWDKKDKKMRLVAQIDFECFTKEKYRLLGNGWRYKNKDRTELMQFTGLKDKNGTEIYEGDILQITRSHYQRKRGEGIWGTKEKRTIKAQMVIRNYIVDIFHLVDFQRQGEKWEVIGNIYENPE